MKKELLRHIKKEWKIKMMAVLTFLPLNSHCHVHSGLQASLSISVARERVFNFMGNHKLAHILIYPTFPQDDYDK